MSLLTILRDNREQKPWTFDDHGAEVRNETITTGDYTLAEFCFYDEDNDTYHPNYAVERKGGEDFIKSITHSRDRFLKEIKRASEWDPELTVLIEEPLRTYKRQTGFMKYRDVSWPAINGTIDKWERFYNVDFRFVGTRDRAQRAAIDLLTDELRSRLVS